MDKELIMGESYFIQHPHLDLEEMYHKLNTEDYNYLLQSSDVTFKAIKKEQYEIGNKKIPYRSTRMYR